MTNEEKILEMLGTMNDHLGRVEAAQTQMQKDLDTVKTAQSQMNDRLGRVETAQTRMQEDLDTVKTAQSQMNDRLGRVETAQTRMQEDITRINVILEVEIDRDIKLLAEGHEGIVEKLDGLDELKESLEETRVKVDAIHAATMENIRDIKVLKRSSS